MTDAEGHAADGTAAPDCDGTTASDGNGTTAPDCDGTADDDHLQDVEPGAGCTEIWEHLSERRDEG